MPPPPPPLGYVGYVLCAILAAAWSGPLITFTQGKPLQVKPGCRYEGRRYQEGAIVSTSEPCLQCRCVEASLRCRLRVCPRTPNPTPAECRLQISPVQECCSEIVCGESRHDNENSLRRIDIEPDNVTEEDEISACEHFHNSFQISNMLFNRCLFEGVRYGAGSAMMATRRCEYCYCILGARRCVSPKCLLPLPGCTPLYAPHSCCPVAYNCTHNQDEETSTTMQSLSLNGCRVGNRVYNEGEMVKDIAWKAPCDNCFCAMGAVRCVPLACAPPLQGCSPIVREGQCCPSTYNCSGSIEVKATQNYASYAFVSKDYANFRKETHFHPVDNQMSPILSNAIVEGRGHRIIEGDSYTTDPKDVEAEDSTSSAYTNGEASTTSTFETDSMGNEIFPDTTGEPVIPTTLQMSNTFSSPFSGEAITSSEVSTLSKESTTVPETSTHELKAPVSTVSTPEETTSAESWSTTEEMSTSAGAEGDPSEQGVDEELDSTEAMIRSTAMASNSSGPTEEPILGTRERHREAETMKEKVITSTQEESVTTSPTTILMPDDIFMMNVTLKSNVSVGQAEGVTITPVRSIAPDVQAILNITQREKVDDYDYYNEPTLPPSLPNVRIIPFVAADALVKNEKDTTSGVTAYPSGSAVAIREPQRTTESSNFYDIVTRENRFSPPIETEGGFVPKDPPYFEASYHSTDLSLEIGTGVTVVPADITNPNRKEDGPSMSSCHFDTRQYRHGEFIPDSGLCVICICYYGEVVCSDEKCPPLKIGCRRVNSDLGCCGEIICIDTPESPTLVLDRADATMPSQREPMQSVDGIATPDPFRDVIKTEPAPDLPSLIEDMIPYLTEHRISTPRPTTPMSNGIKISSTIRNGDINQDPSLMEPPIYNHGDQMNPHKDDEVIVSNSPTSVANEVGHNSFVQHLNQPLQEVGNDTQDNEEHNDKFVTQNSSGFNYSKYGDKDVSLNSNGSMQDLGFESNPEITESIPLKSDKAKDTVTKLSQGDSNDEEDSMYSFESVFDLLFSDSKTEKPAAQVSIQQAVFSTGETSTSQTVTKASSTLTALSTTPSPSPAQTTKSSIAKPTTLMIFNTSNSAQVRDEDVSTMVGSLLKLAGCNIYGRMYRVGKIITELSGPCLQCRCTEVGVQCKKLSCR
ncbi:uncharacterized protein LOC124305078 isoform X1 [Neodiprion virginianus]|uniref:uncharacterized protein LOC124305078 isoform X1 n=1 Tax=Neodiprion virginianus TaxID=2961670 RepID=UPI001EE7280E|nr:uncharacterized protein LOC124305078 isoform X1 [Neodiprion virginianus]